MYNNNIRSQSSFSRTVDNTAKMGAYYTDVDHCKDIRKLLVFPEDKEVCVLEPSIGDGSAVIAATGAQENPKIKIFGVELNHVSADMTKENPLIEECLEADFLEGVRIKNNAFSLCFGNPPYMEDDLAEGGRERVEKQFLEKVTNYVQKDGLLVWVIPYVSFVEPTSLRFLMSHYDILCVYKFREAEFKKFHQVVVIARKVEARNIIKPQLDDALEKFTPLDKISTLPSEETDVKYEVFPSSADKITLFCNKEFDVNAAFIRLRDMGNDEFFDDLNRICNKAVTQEAYKVGDIGRPPIPLKKDSLYLMATTGCGQGLAGSEEKGDIHLQRGVAEVIEESEFIEDDSGKVVEKLTSKTKVTMTIVEQSGKITQL